MNIEKTKLQRFLSSLPEYACLVVLVFVLVSAGALAPNFFTAENLLNVLKQASVVCIVAIGMGCVLISGCIDLSVGVIMAICAILSMTLQKLIGDFGVITLTLGAGMLLGLTNFFIVYITRARAIEIMMLTFGLKMAYRGLAQALTGNATLRESASPFFSFLGKGVVGHIPCIVLIMLGVAIVVGMIMWITRFGREVISIGNNPEACRLSGINISKTRLKCFLISGFCCAVAGILLASRTRAVNALSGDGYEMDAMCGLIIGGYAVFGGYGSVWRAVIGVFEYSAIKNVMNLLGVNTYGQQLAQGLILLAAVWADVNLRERRLGGKGR